jgi:N-acetylmuramoyl-L-alanine amidase
MASAEAARARLCDPVHEVSAHWLVDVDGRAEALVDEGRRAWHAGAGAWGGCTDVNSASIGIEIQNDGASPFPARQMAGLERLLGDVMGRWSIGPEGVIGHSDMAPERKRDPGPRFDWRRLALGGLAVWPRDRVGKAQGFLPAAVAFGYRGAEEPVLAAFRLRFRPWGRGPVSAVDAGLAMDLAERFPALV